MPRTAAGADPLPDAREPKLCRDSYRQFEVEHQLVSPLAEFFFKGRESPRSSESSRLEPPFDAPSQMNR